MDGRCPTSVETRQIDSRGGNDIQHRNGRVIIDTHCIARESTVLYNTIASSRDFGYVNYLFIASASFIYFRLQAQA